MRTALTVGIKGKRSMVVTHEDLASVMGSSSMGLDIFATPAMILLMEATAVQSILPYCAEGEGTVGSLLQIEHVAPTLEGAHVTCESELVEIDGRRLVFRVTASDECGVIGAGTHERYLITIQRFIDKAVNRKG